MTDGILTKSARWHEQQAQRWVEQDIDACADKLVRRCTEAEWDDITDRAEGKAGKYMLAFLKDELLRVNSYPTQIVNQRDRCEQTCLDVIAAFDTCGKDSNQYRDAEKQADDALAKLKEYLDTYASDPSWFDWLDYNALTTNLRNGG